MRERRQQTPVWERGCQTPYKVNRVGAESCVNLLNRRHKSSNRTTQRPRVRLNSALQTEWDRVVVATGPVTEEG